MAKLDEGGDALSVWEVPHADRQETGAAKLRNVLLVSGRCNSQVVTFAGFVACATCQFLFCETTTSVSSADRHSVIFPQSGGGDP